MPKRKIITYCRIKHTDKRLYIAQRNQFDANVAAWAKDDEDVFVKLTIEEVYRKHSDKQRGYYFGVIVDILARLIADSCGEEVQPKHHKQAHEELKRMCNPIEIASPVTGEVIVIAGSTKDQDTVESSDFHERCRQWIFEFWGVVVPLPNEQAELFETKTK